MAEDYETLAERTAKINEANARIDAAIANDTANGMAEEAARERRRADAIADGNNRLSQDLNTTRYQRSAAQSEAAAAQNDASTSAFGFWLLASLVIVGLVIAGIFWANQNGSSSTAGSSEMPPAVVTRTVTVAASPTPAAIATPAPSVVKEYIPVPAPAPQARPLQGYVDHTPRVAPESTPAPTPSAARLDGAQNSDTTQSSSDTPNSSSTSNSDSSTQSSDSSAPMNGYVAH